MILVFLDSLNERQKEAVTHVDGPLLIIAGAGSGKTRVLTYRVAYLISECGIRPDQILAVTFTNKAAQEMKERIIDLIGNVGKWIWISTFHSCCVQILRVEADKIGYRRDFLIFDTVDQNMVIKDCLKELNLDPQRFEPRALAAAISKAKNNLLDPKLYSDKVTDFWGKQVSRVYQLYQSKLEENNALDFDDLIMKTVQMLKTNSEVRAKYQERFRYILVDEYQDTNHAQYELVNLLAEKYQNTCVVGDDDQSIYAFRGADIRNILEFEKDYPNTKIIRLEENYRSTQNILTAANKMIENNTERKGKTLYTQKGTGNNLRFYQASDERQEAEFIAEVITETIRYNHYSYQDFTILYRIHAQSRIIEEEFVRRQIPYRIVSGLRFYELKEIKDLLAYLRLLVNPLDNYSFKRIINVPKRGIGNVTIAKIEDFAAGHNCSLSAALDRLDELDNITGNYKKSLVEFRELMMALMQFMEENNSVTSIVEKVLHDSGYIDSLSVQNKRSEERRIENLNEFLTVTKQFDQEEGSGGLGDFLEKIALMSDVDNYDQGADAVSLMTLHAAKGLEFPVVFLVGMEDGVFPGTRSIWEPGQIEEERRLAYVGLTRAQEQIYLTCAQRRMLFGVTQENPVSMFVKEIPEKLIDEISSYFDLRQIIQRDFKRDFAAARLNCDEESSEFKIGDQVHHRHFGIGEIVDISGDLVSIVFSNKETKKFSRILAPIEKI